MDTSAGVSISLPSGHKSWCALQNLLYLVQHYLLFNVQHNLLFDVQHNLLRKVQLQLTAMATPNKKLAESLQVLKELQQKSSIIRSSDLTRTHRERLIRNKFIERVTKGWYIVVSPDAPGDTTQWYHSFWEFCSYFLNDKLKDTWCLTAEQSIAIHTEDFTVPRQLLVKSSKGTTKNINLLEGTSIYHSRSQIPDANNKAKVNGLRLYSLPYALVHASPVMYRQDPVSMRVALKQYPQPGPILAILLRGGHSVIAGRIAGAYRNIGNGVAADTIVSAMRAADFEVREINPFESPSQFDNIFVHQSPAVLRITEMWNRMRSVVLEYKKPAPSVITTVEYLDMIEGKYTQDAYHSLSIEGYKVTGVLIEKVRRGDWDPKQNIDDEKDQNAMAARGYYQAFRKVKGTVEKVLSGVNAGHQVELDHAEWYQDLFGPSVISGLLNAADLAGYRNRPAFIGGSKHVPMNFKVVPEAMSEFFNLLKQEEDSFVRVILGHFILVFIHPYPDGNGRMGRFLMNVMMASGGYHWTVIEYKDRKEYMEALEKASVNKDISVFAKFISEKTG